MNRDTSAETFDFTDLGEKLRGPEGPDIAAASISRLGQLAREVSGKISGGLPPSEYERNAALLDALAAAETVMIDISSLMTSVPSEARESPSGNMGE